MSPNQANNIESFTELLHSLNLKATGQRIAVHTAMLELGHASADMVKEKLDQKGCKVTVASVYNTLTQLAMLGIYKHRLSANNKMYFDVSTFKHMHLYDVYNNSFKDIVNEDIQKQIEDILLKQKFKGYKVDGVDIQILCHPSHRKTPLSF